MSTSRSHAAQLARQTLTILEEGRYATAAGVVVPVGDAVRRAVEGTASYPSDRSVPDPPAVAHETRFDVVNATTLAAARGLADDGHRVAALNFASAKNPGGGFLNGARAQEESLARSSGLYACLNGHPMYGHHRAQGGAFYTGYVIYSPDVPVFRDDDGILLDTPWPCSFLTSPAVNAGVVLERDGSARRRAEVREAMRERVHKVLTVAALHEHVALVLGAWGCGVFRNDPAEVAGLFRQALTGPFRGVFERVVFAVLDWSADDAFIGPFREAFPA